MDKTDRNTIEELLPRYCEGVATEEERLQVEMWMSESDENRRMAKQIHALYLATDTVNVMKKVDTEKALLKVKSRMSGNRHKGTMWWQWHRHGELPRLWDLSLVLCGRALYFSAQDPLYQ